MTTQALADALDRYADFLATTEVASAADGFRRVAERLRTGPEAVSLVHLYDTVTVERRESYLDRADWLYLGDDPDRRAIGTRIFADAEAIADLIRQIALSPEAYAEYHRLEAERQALSRRRDPESRERERAVYDERRRVLAPLLPPPASGDQPPPNDLDMVLRWIGRPLVLIGKIVLWVFVLAFVWAVLDALWPF
ncbi:MAG: hypothetical protein AAFQ43_02165 [Bacteroidota bacterium]